MYFTKREFMDCLKRRGNKDYPEGWLVGVNRKGWEHLTLAYPLDKLPEISGDGIFAREDGKFVDKTTGDKYFTVDNGWLQWPLEAGTDGGRTVYLQRVVTKKPEWHHVNNAFGHYTDADGYTGRCHGTLVGLNLHLIDFRELPQMFWINPFRRHDVYDSQTGKSKRLVWPSELFTDVLRRNGIKFTENEIGRLRRIEYIRDGEERVAYVLDQSLYPWRYGDDEYTYSSRFVAEGESSVIFAKRLPSEKENASFVNELIGTWEYIGQQDAIWF